MGIPEREKWEKERESQFKYITHETFQKLWKDLDPDIQKSNYLNQKRASPR